ncbi:MAG: cell division protein FtsA [Prevotellaceae bacterium]|nr:cell division protein FtsA [Prevotellaceae bacterium]
MENYVMAVDIGSTKIAAFLGRVADRQIVVEEHHAVPSQGVLRGEVANVEDTVMSIKQCLGGLRGKLDARGLNVNVTEVVVGIAGRHIECRKETLSKFRQRHKSPVSARELAEMKGDVKKIPLKAGAKILDVFERGITIDGEQQSQPVGCVGAMLAVSYLVVTGEIGAIKRIEDCVGRCELNINKLMLEPVASANAVLTRDETKQGVALLDIGGGTSDLIIYHDDRVCDLAVITCGGVLITKDIMHTCGLTYAQAEQLKCDHGACLASEASERRRYAFASGAESTLSEKTLATIIQKRVEQIVDAVGYIIEQNGRDKVRSIVLTGGGSRLKHLPQLVSLHTGLDVRVGYPTVQVATESCDLAPEYATAVGLMMNASNVPMKQNGRVPWYSSIKSSLEGVMGAFDSAFKEDNSRM